MQFFGLLDATDWSNGTVYTVFTASASASKTNSHIYSPQLYFNINPSISQQTIPHYNGYQHYVSNCLHAYKKMEYEIINSFTQVLSAISGVNKFLSAILGVNT